MTVSPSADKKNLLASGQLDENDAGEVVPSYEEATGIAVNNDSGPSSSSGQQHAPTIAQQQQQQPQSQRMYPFPSLGSQHEGYGQSPYQPDGTLRIVIAHGHPGGDGNDRSNLLPLHANSTGSQQRRGPRAGRRFCAAFFWAFVLYILLATVFGIVWEIDDDAMPPTGGPPGWHHHHDRNNTGRHPRQSFYQRITYRIPSIDSSASD